MAAKVRKVHYRIGVEWSIPFTLTIHFWRWTFKWGQA